MRAPLLAVEWRYGQGICDSRGIPERKVYQFATSAARDTWVADGNCEWRNDARYREPITRRELHKTERAGLIERVAIDPRAHLARLLATSGVSATAFARALGSDRTRVDDWLSGAIEIPQTAQAWIAGAEATDGAITTTVGELRVTVQRTGPRRRS